MLVPGRSIRQPVAVGYFSPLSVFWRVNREMLMALAGSRAVLLELAHPLIAEGVARHSDFRQNRFRRLFRTLRLMIACCFEDPQQHLRQMASRHQTVAGRLSTAVGAHAQGSGYSAGDPHLRLWVWATLIDSTLAVYERIFRPLNVDETQSFYRDSRTLARLFDIPAELVPPTHSDFKAYFAAMIASDRLTVSETAKEQVELLFGGPVTGRAVRYASELGVSLLPARIRADFGLETKPRKVERVLRVLRAVRRILPDVLCVWPQATLAERRALKRLDLLRHRVP